MCRKSRMNAKNLLISARVLPPWGGGVGNPRSSSRFFARGVRNFAVSKNYRQPWKGSIAVWGRVLWHERGYGGHHGM